MVYIIFDQSLNFSQRMGIPVHGILGNGFFKNFIVKINYITEKITIYRPEDYIYKNCGTCEDLDIAFENDKPFISLTADRGNETSELTLLVDSGSSDAMWLFETEGFIEENPKNYFEDFLGLGLSGNIF